MKAEMPQFQRVSPYKGDSPFFKNNVPTEIDGFIEKVSHDETMALTDKV